MDGSWIGGFGLGFGLCVVVGKLGVCLFGSFTSISHTSHLSTTYKYRVLVQLHGELESDDLRVQSLDLTQCRNHES